MVFLEKAVGDAEGTAQLVSQNSMSHLESSAEGLSQSWAETQPRYEQSGQRYEVEVTTLDTIADKQGRPPDVLKIDAEGSEVAILSGARGLLESSPPVILCEFHSPELATLGGELLREYGYRFWEVGNELKSVRVPTFYTLAVPKGYDR